MAQASYREALYDHHPFSSTVGVTEIVLGVGEATDCALVYVDATDCGLYDGVGAALLT